MTLGKLIRSLEWQGAARLTDTPQTANTFETLYQSGMTAFRTGDNQRAHELWRDAAAIDPYQEKLWVALLHVLESPDDRRVCLENILAINPGSTKARRDLLTLDRTAAHSKEGKRKLPRSIQFMLSILRGMLIGVLATAIGVGVSVILYGLVTR